MVLSPLGIEPARAGVLQSVEGEWLAGGGVEARAS